MPTRLPQSGATVYVRCPGNNCGDDVAMEYTPEWGWLPRYTFCPSCHTPLDRGAWAEELTGAAQVAFDRDGVDD